MRVILHADMDAFYASVEQRDAPELAGRPVIVGGTSKRGVVSAASYEARAFGVRSAMPTAQARKLCPEGVFLPGDMRKYARESERIFAVFERFTPLVEGVSLDEAFLDVTGTEAIHGPPAALGARLRAEVRRETGLAVSVGIGPVKLVAKLASDLAKPDGLLVVEPGRVREFLDPLPVGRIWGVGPVARAQLEARGIATIGELARAPEALLRQALGLFGPEVARLARGEDAREVTPSREPKSYGEENTFAEDVRDRARLERAIRSHAEAVARRLRHDGLVARGVQLKLKLARPLGGGRYPLLTRAATFPATTSDGKALADAACALLASAPGGEPIRLVGVAATRLAPARDDQLELFGGGDPARRQRLNQALDAIRERFGATALVRGAPAEERAGLSLARKRGDTT
jgi:DNA polymerase-4